VEVHYDEGIASHIGPESCAGVREGAGEALTGEHTGQPLSRESAISGADSVKNVEGKTTGRVNERHERLPRAAQDGRLVDDHRYDRARRARLAAALQRLWAHRALPDARRSQGCGAEDLIEPRGLLRPRGSFF